MVASSTVAAETPTGTVRHRISARHRAIAFFKFFIVNISFQNNVMDREVDELKKPGTIPGFTGWNYQIALSSFLRSKIRNSAHSIMLSPAVAVTMGIEREPVWGNTKVLSLTA